MKLKNTEILVNWIDINTVKNFKNFHLFINTKD